MGIENKFNDYAAKALYYAKEYAAENGHTVIGSEHLLIGLIRETGSIAAKTLQSFGLNEDSALEQLSGLVGMCCVPEDSIRYDYFGRKKSYTPAAKKITERAYDISRQFGGKLAGTEHVLMAILRSGDCVALRLLEAADISTEKMYDVLSEKCMPSLYDNDIQRRTHTPNLDKYSRDLTDLARIGELDEVVGRTREIERAVNILSRRTKNNPCIIGEPGVGKTAIAEAIAQRIVRRELPEEFHDKRIVAMDLSAMVAGTKYRGDFEDRFKKVLDEVKKSKNVILFIDELHTVVGAGAAEGAIDAASILKPPLSRGEIQVIGATTVSEYRKYIEKDKALERRFQPVMVEPSTPEETKVIINGIKSHYERYHSIIISDEAVSAAIALSSRYIQDRFVPDKAIDLIDEAASKLHLSSYKTSDGTVKLNEKYKKLTDEMDKAIARCDYETAADKKLESDMISKKIESASKRFNLKRGRNKPVLLPEHISAAVSAATGIPVTELGARESGKLIALAETLSRDVKGQDDAVVLVAKAVKRGRVGLNDPKRPIGSFIFAGPTGVGKTSLSKSLAAALLGSDDSLIRIDMSEYMEKHSVAKLIGAPPGYVGYAEGGQLTERVRRHPYSVVLFDEIEKAHPDVFNILLQVLEDGALTDSDGRTVSFKNTVIIMTSNVGAREITEKNRLGFEKSGADDYKTVKQNVTAEIKRLFKPEFINRVDEIVVFKPLDKNRLAEIADGMLSVLAKRFENKGIHVTFDSGISAYIAEKCEKIYGARPLRRIIQDAVENPAADMILEGRIPPESNVEFVISDGEIKIKESAEAM